MKRLCLVSILSLIIYVAASLPLTASGIEKPLVYTVRVENTVTAGTAGYISRGLETARENNADAVVLLINTPGGLVTATLDIIRAISASSVPVVTFVTPEGAIAASAGTFILLSGHVASMSPGTTCGAAMPVTMSAPGQRPRAADQKTINFLAGHMKSIARERGRPQDIAEKFVKENLTLTAAEALDKGVVNFSARNLDELLGRLDGLEVGTVSGKKVLHTAKARVTDLPMTTTEKFVNIISNPAIAAVFLLVGIFGLIIGFSSPGFFLPEVSGSILLILGLYGTGLFRVNLAAVLLLLLGIVLLIAEAVTPAFGILGVGGVVSTVFGLLLFPFEPLMPLGWFASYKLLALGVGAIGAVLIIVIVTGILRIRRLTTVQGEFEFRETPALVIEDINPRGRVKIRGEIWIAVSQDGETIEAGDSVRILERRGLTLVVEPYQNN